MSYGYISKRVRIEAFQMTKEARRDNSRWPHWLIAAIAKPSDMAGAVTSRGVPSDEDVCDLQIKTLEGIHDVTWNDYIIRGTIGELYPCKPHVFEAKYEPEEVAK